jgi:hypothetical protein
MFLRIDDDGDSVDVLCLSLLIFICLGILLCK